MHSSLQEKMKILHDQVGEFQIAEEQQADPMYEHINQDNYLIENVELDLNEADNIISTYKKEIEGDLSRYPPS
jgi:hypothetical protein